MVSGPIETAGPRPPIAAYARAAEGDARTTRSASGSSRRELARAVQRDEVGVQLVDEQPPGGLGARKEHAPGRPRQLGEQALLGRGPRHEVRAAERVRRRPSDCRELPRPSSPPAAELPRPHRARDEHPVVAVEVDRLVAERLDRDQRHALRLVTRLAECAGKLLVASLRPGQQDPHGTSASSSCPRRTGSSPVLRSTQLPSSAATSAVSFSPSWWAATGARQPPPTAATHARSASTRRLVSAWSAWATWRLLARTNLQRERALPRLRKQLVRLEATADLASEAQAVEPARRENDRVEAPLVALPEPGVDVPAHRLDPKLRLQREQLRAAAHRRGPDPHPRPDGVRAAERVPRILPLEVGADGEPLRVGRGHVLRRVDGDVDPAFEQRLLELLDEDAARADLAERLRPVAVAGGRDRHERELEPGPAQPLDRELGLRQREPATPRADPEEHGARPPRRARPPSGA